MIEDPGDRNDGASAGGPVPLWTVCPNGTAAVLDPLRNEVRWLSGSSLLPDSAVIRVQFERELRNSPYIFSPVLPEYMDLRCDGTDRLWLQRFDVEGGRLGRSRAWIRVDRSRVVSDGETAGATQRVEFPERFTPLHFGDDRAWGVVLDELEVPSVGWVAMP